MRERKKLSPAEKLRNRYHYHHQVLFFCVEKSFTSIERSFTIVVWPSTENSNKGNWINVAWEQLNELWNENCEIGENGSWGGFRLIVSWPKLNGWKKQQEKRKRKRSLHINAFNFSVCFYLLFFIFSLSLSFLARFILRSKTLLFTFFIFTFTSPYFPSILF